jgi:N-acetylglutamate synthase-like GNAT family acetyltransferase
MIQELEEKKDNYILSTKKNKLDITLIHHYLSTESYWAKNIPLDTVKKSIENSMCFGIYIENNQIGFARVISDYATFAYMADVFILKPYRGKGLSKWLIECILKDPKLQGLRRFCLGTHDAHSLYAKFNFKVMAKPENWMEIKKEKLYER